MVEANGPFDGPSSADETVATPTRASSGTPSSTLHSFENLVERPGTVVGHYKLIEPIGEGAFGIVFKASQEAPVKRLVALKVIKLGMDTRDVVTRFEAERQALAMMEHPCIAKVFDAGATQLGRPYFVMELVEGQPIAAFCDEHKLSVRERIELFMDVCAAVQHAHQKGVIHRDLKPSNILVAQHDARPSPKVIDFGIAKATEQKLTERTMHTHHGQFMGTPAYMSPEQAEMSGLDVDTRSDIYSLGVVLYELLTGAMPFDIRTGKGTSIDELRRIIREGDPIRPSTRLSSAGKKLTEVASCRGVEPKRLGGMLRGDLDWIVMKALERDRNRRYESANGFRLDLERFLHGEPVLAAPPNAGYRLQKFVRRNKGVVTAGATVAVALFTGAVAFAWQANVARRQRDIAVEAQRAEAEERRVAAEQRDRARIEAAKSERTTDFITSIFNGIDPYTSQGMDTALIRKILAKVEDRISSELAGQPEVEAAIRGTLGRAYTGLGQYETAELQFAQALSLLESSVGKDDRQTYRIHTGRSFLLERLGKSYENEKLCQTTLTAMRQNLGESDRDTIGMMSQLGAAQSRIGKYREAEQSLRTALRRETSLLGENHPRTILTMMRLAEVLNSQSRFAEAEKLARKVVDQRKANLGAESAEVFEALSTVAGSLRGLERFEEAEQLDRDIIARLTEVLGADNSQTLNMCNNLALTLQLQGRNDEAEALYRETLERRRRVLGEDHPLTLFSVANLGEFLERQGRIEEAEPLTRLALEERLRVLGEEHKDTLTSMRSLAKLEKNERDFAGAAKRFEHIVTVERRHLSDTDPSLGISLYNWAAMLQDGGDHAAAEPIFREVIAMHTKAKWRDAAFVAAAYNGVGRCLESKGDYVSADEFYRAGLEMRRRLFSKPDRDLAYSLNDYGTALLIRGDYQAAEPLLRENLEVVRATLPDDAWQVGDAMTTYGASLAGLGRFVEAEPLLLEGFEKLNQNTEPKPNVLGHARRRIEDLYKAWNDSAPDSGSMEALARWQAKYSE